MEVPVRLNTFLHWYDVLCNRHGFVPVKRDAAHGWHGLHCFTEHCFGGCRLELIGQKLRYILSEECTPVFASCNLLLLAPQFFFRSSSLSGNRSEMAFAGRCCSSRVKTLGMDDHFGLAAQRTLKEW